MSAARPATHAALAVKQSPVAPATARRLQQASATTRAPGLPGGARPFLLTPRGDRGGQTAGGHGP
eukprot:10235371-Lingulodinium_polyedra.AAC.1